MNMEIKRFPPARVLAKTKSGRTTIIVKQARVSEKMRQAIRKKVGLNARHPFLHADPVILEFCSEPATGIGKLRSYIVLQGGRFWCDDVWRIHHDGTAEDLEAGRLKMSLSRAEKD